MEILNIQKLAGFVLLVAFVVFAFRQGRKVKPDRNHKPEHNDWQRIIGGGPGDGAGHHPS